MIAKPILTADDYGIAAGVSRSIRELAAADRLSATSAMTNMPAWVREAAALRPLRARLAIGLHLNLSVGAPLGPMPRLAPAGRFPGLSEVIRPALLGRLDPAEIGDEIDRQLDAFEGEIGHPPDHVDGHQHVHALRIVRDALVDRIARRYGARPPLIRLPVSTAGSLTRLGATGIKGAIIGLLSRGLAHCADSRGMPLNDAFAGFSGFDARVPYADELAAALDDRAIASARRPIIMCHPGYPDAELAAVDPILERRRQELEALAAFPELPQRIWHPRRAADGPMPDWAGAAM